MGRSKSSGRWLKEHHSDVYVREAQASGYRSRAAFKLLEIQRRDRILRPGMVVVDLGAAPGGWSKVAAEISGANGRVIALDLLEMPEIAGVEFIRGDFSENSVLADLERRLGGAQVDLVLSDMAPNMSGIRAVDQARSMALAELALGFAVKFCKPGAALLTKVFEGAGMPEFRLELKQSFARVQTRKPDASRARSREHYLLATNYTV